VNTLKGNFVPHQMGHSAEKPRRIVKGASQAHAGTEEVGNHVRAAGLSIHLPAE
jgi:hypothetical protein